METEELDWNIQYEQMVLEGYTHPPTNECDEDECMVCGIRDCPYGEPLHYHHDGCPAFCWFDKENTKFYAN